MTLSPRYSKYPAKNFTAAAKRLHNNYSDKPWEETDYADQTWASGTLRGIIEDLGASEGVTLAEERIDSLRQSNLGQGEALNRIWRAMYGNRQPEQSNYNVIADGIIQGLEDKMPPPEITDSLVNEIALAAFGPSVVYDRERMRAALAQALQTR